MPTPTQTDQKAAILVVDDDPGLCAMVVEILGTAGHDAVGADGPEQALDLAGSNHFDLVLSDVMMPGMNGPELIERLHAIEPHLIAAIMTGRPTEELAIRSVNMGVTGFLTKGVFP